MKSFLLPFMSNLESMITSSLNSKLSLSKLKSNYSSNKNSNRSNWIWRERILLSLFSKIIKRLKRREKRDLEIALRRRGSWKLRNHQKIKRIIVFTFLLQRMGGTMGWDLTSPRKNSWKRHNFNLWVRENRIKGFKRICLKDKFLEVWILQCFILLSFLRYLTTHNNSTYKINKTRLMMIYYTM